MINMEENKVPKKTPGEILAEMINEKDPKKKKEKNDEFEKSTINFFASRGIKVEINKNE